VLKRLFSPLRIGQVELSNRIVSTAHQTTLVHESVPTDDFVAYHEARARGGTGLIVLEPPAASHPAGCRLPLTPCDPPLPRTRGAIWDETASEIRSPASSGVGCL
jgi:2,4-dienoyl-CoA reductase-like NADH-dependent reductase (Old Yellow Enzyme family)